MRRTLNRLLALVTITVMMFSMLPMSSTAMAITWTTYTVTAWSNFGSAGGNVWEVGRYPVSGGTIVLPAIADAGGTVITIPANVIGLTIKGGGTAVINCSIALASGRSSSIALTIENLDLTAGLNQSGIDFTNAGGFGADLQFKGTNTVKAGTGTGAGICIPKNIAVSLNEATANSGAILNASGGVGEAGTASFTGAGIGSPKFIECGYVDIVGGIINATAYEGSAAIGGGRGSGGDTGGAGTVSIQGGTITATGGDYGAGIGGGWAGKGGIVTISGGTVTATGGDSAQGIGPGAGGQSNAVTVTGGTITATGGSDGAGISAGYEGTIDISGGTITATGASSGAGIGGSRKTGGGTITISDGTILATGGYGAAGIGGGYGEDYGHYNAGGAGEISISGGTIVAYGGGYAAGIGNGWCVSSHGGNIVITGSPSILAVRGTSASDSTWDDIGRGKDGINDAVTLTDGNENELTYIRFHVDTAISAATITVGVGETTDLGTNVDGDAAFYVSRVPPALPYTITKIGYKNIKGTVSPDVGSITKYVTMVEGVSDVTAPSFAAGYPKATDVLVKDFTLTVQSNEAGKAYYLVQDHAEGEPTSAEIMAANSITVTSADIEYSVSVTGLSPDTSYDVYVMLEDAELNLSVPEELLVKTAEADETAPAFIATFPQIKYITETKAMLMVQVSEDCLMYICRKLSGDPAPDEEFMSEGNSYTTEMSTIIPFTLEDMDSDTSYDYYVMLQDASENRSDIVKLQVTTLADNSGIITFDDEDLLNELIDSSVDANDDERISMEEAADCTELVMDDCSIDDLEGLQYFHYLDTIELEDNAISDIGAFAEMPLLETLYLDGNKITDVSVLAGLTELGTIELDDNLISDISPLADLPLLEYVSVELNCLDITEGSATMDIIEAWEADSVEVYYDPQLLDLDIDYDVGSPEITDITSQGFTLTVGGGTGTTDAIESDLGDFEYYTGYYIVEHDAEEGYFTDEDAFDWVWWDGEWEDLAYNEDTERYEYVFDIGELDPETEYDVYTLIEVKDDNTDHSYVSVVKRVSATTAEAPMVDFAPDSPAIADVTDEGFTLTITGGDGTKATLDDMDYLEPWISYYIVAHDDEAGYLTDEEAESELWDGTWVDSEDGRYLESGLYELELLIEGLDPGTEYDVYMYIDCYGEDDNINYLSDYVRLSVTTLGVDYAPDSPAITDITTDGFTLTVTGGEGTNSVREAIDDMIPYLLYYIVKHDDEVGYLTDEDAAALLVDDGIWPDPEDFYTNDDGNLEIVVGVEGLDPDTEYDIYMFLDIFDNGKSLDHISDIARLTFTTAAPDGDLGTLDAEEGEGNLEGSVEGVEGTTFDPDTEFIIEKVTAEVSESDTAGFNTGVGLLVSGKAISEIYSIRLMLDGDPVQPAGPVKVRIKLTAEQIALGGLEIVYIDDLGVVTLIPSTIEDGYIVFTTDHFSYYGLIAFDNPQTGDAGAAIPMLALFVAVGTLMLARRRRAARSV